LAAQGLDLCVFKISYYENTLLSLIQIDCAVGRNEFMKFTQQDFDTLKPDKFFNDVVIGIWLLWMYRNECHGTSNILVLYLQ